MTISKFSCFVVLLLVTLVSVPLVAQGISNNQTSVDENKLGYAAYLNKDYPTALTHFDRASRLDPTWAVPAYNAACTLALFDAANPCDYPPEMELGLYGYLHRAITNFAGYKTKMMTDSDLKSVHNRVEFQVEAGANIANAPDLRKLILSQSWYGNRGALGNLSPALSLSADGSGEIEVFVMSDEEYGPRTESITWRMEGTTLIIRHKDGTIQRGKLIYEGPMKGEQPGLDFDGDLGALYQYWTECGV